MAYRRHGAARAGEIADIVNLAGGRIIIPNHQSGPAAKSSILQSETPNPPILNRQTVTQSVDRRSSMRPRPLHRIARE
jgi:hypothetical protein